MWNSEVDIALVVQEIINPINATKLSGGSPTVG
jgi:hypothetical protein